MWGLLCALCCLASVFALDAPRAETENGPVVGTYETSYLGRKYSAFRGIPYAEPPVGDNRFKEAQPLKHKWIGEWQATAYGSGCLCLDQFSDVKYEPIIRGDEDCLFLNVFTQEGGPKKKDVVVMIHGGAFMFGSSDMYGPKYMMDRDDIIYVSINYRLGALGFITTGDSVVPGNNGLKDQNAALQWVNRNIANFGGDPSKITLAGLSAGGASVDYHFLSDLSKGLFQRGISFSGSALSPWAFVESGVERTKKLAEGLGCPTNSSKSLVKCMRRRPARQIVEQMRNLFVWMYHPFTLFGPVMEVGSSRPFIDKTPAEIHRLGLAQQLPWIGGLTTEEGLYPAAEFMEDEKLMKKVNDEWKTIGASLLFTNPRLRPQETEELVENARKHYLGEEKISPDTAESLVKMLSDRLYADGLVKTALNRAGARVFRYGYQSASSVAHLMAHNVRNYGASHGDDMQHLVDFNLSPSHRNKRDIQAAQVLKDIFFTFVKTGEVPKQYKDWEPLAIANKYLFIESPDKITVENESFVDLDEQARIFGQQSKNKDEL